ncbi:hypothetical protein SCHPADRAFT_582631 [Schizopora paradoxa]|uniref:Uncharacterized protein n=1 Tax=Schizopora paradoxa TaxID=27342 RepID=A0A0H2RWA9_9AGAM|nr:hypothetical protein SCHPADRAFT_582631 [Schizopora paradoxa]
MEHGGLQWLTFNPPATYKTPESSLQHAITPPDANIRTASASASSSEPTGPVDSASLVNEPSQQTPSAEPPAVVPPARSEAALFATTPLSFPTPDVSGTTGSASAAQASKPTRQRKTAKKGQEKSTTQPPMQVEPSVAPTPSDMPAPQGPQGQNVWIAPAGYPIRGPTFSVGAQPAEPHDTAPPAKRRRRRNLTETPAPSTSAVPPPPANLQHLPTVPPPPPPGYPYGYGGYPPPYPPHYIPPSGSHWYPGYPPPPHHGHVPPPVGYDVRGQHPYQFQYPYMPPPPQNGAYHWAPGQVPPPPAPVPPPAYAPDRSLEASGVPAPSASASSSAVQHDEPEVDLPQPDDEPMQPQENNRSPPINHNASPNGSLAQDNLDSTTKSSKAAKKICGSSTCALVLPKSYPFKLCSDCRKKQKLKKKMGEMKRRLKLVGSASGKPKSIGSAQPATADSDVDAEGDIDMDE